MDSYTYGSMVEHGGYASGGSVAQLITAGFTPESATSAVTSSDMRLLRHSGVISIQLRPPAARDDDEGSAGVPAMV